MRNWIQYRPDEFGYLGKWVKNWFSNMVVCPITIDGINYNSTENYFQAMKSPSREDHLRIAILAPNKSKHEGRKLQLPPNWDEIKYDVMCKALRVKFNLPGWKEELLATGDSVLIEWNNWNDKIWGVSIVDNLGENLLGLALMEIREELK
jgi:ribA/ribD-fused uncharacterized protein